MEILISEVAESLRELEVQGRRPSFVNNVSGLRVFDEQ